MKAEVKVWKVKVPLACILFGDSATEMDVVILLCQACNTCNVSQILDLPWQIREA